jgi:hypothetical protein
MDNNKNLILREKNNVFNEIKIIEGNIERNKNTIERLKQNSDINGVNFTKIQLEKLIIKNKELDNEIIKLNIRIDELNQNKVDNILQTKINNEKLKLNKLNLQDNKKKQDKKDQKNEDELKLKKYYNNNKFDTSEFHHQKETNKFCKDLDTVPDYILEKLKDMPSNKGYIWRGIWCFGKLPSQGNKITMFEKCRNNLLKIIECDEEYRYFYEKNGKENKILIKKEVRMKKTSNNLFFL